MMFTGVNVYKRTDDLALSEPQMARDWSGFKHGEGFEVPLHENDEVYGTLATGLIPLEPDHIAQGLVDFIAGLGWDPNFPPMNNASMLNSMNGCALGQSANRTYHLDEGDYILETQGSHYTSVCNNFNVRMVCPPAGGAETAAPGESDPLGFAVDAKTGHGDERHNEPSAGNPP